MAADPRSPSAAPASVTREMIENAHLIESFSVFVHGATSPSGERAVVLAVFPPSYGGWTFPLPVSEARRIAALLIEKAGESDA